MFKISTYLKCQLWGWGLFSFLVNRDIFLAPGNKIFFNLVKLVFPLFASGLLFSHVMKLLIKRLKLPEKPVSKQILPALLLTIFFGSLVGIFGIPVLFTENWSKHSVAETYFLITNSLLSGIVTLLIWNLIYFSYRYIQQIKKQEQEKVVLKIKAVEAEARILRAQMNPHFVFNCLNSIKSLIQLHEKNKSITYLTTFSKLIRTLFQNSDKRQISLYDEIETCKLYLQLEAMRFDASFSFAVHIDDDIDLKSIEVPALIIQPFIENAIWHGIVPRSNDGRISLDVLQKKNGIIEVVIDDNGIGREASAQNKSASGLTHQSKGVNLTQSRLELNNLLQQRQAELETIDKKDSNGLATGTTVIIKLKEELS